MRESINRRIGKISQVVNDFKQVAETYYNIIVTLYYLHADFISLYAVIVNY